MNFDPAVEAQVAFQRSRAGRELGDAWDKAEELEARFSASAGPEAVDAYRQLLGLGSVHAQAAAFHEFLIYITWQQVTEQTIPEYFRVGARMCDQFLAHPPEHVSAQSLAQVRALRRSFREGLGLSESDDMGEEYDRDAFHGGD